MHLRPEAWVRERLGCEVLEGLISMWVKGEMGEQGKSWTREGSGLASLPTHPAFETWLGATGLQNRAHYYLDFFL